MIVLQTKSIWDEYLMTKWKTIDNQIHRYKHSAELWKRLNGKKCYEYWMQFDLFHRLNKPAIISYDYKGHKICQQHWIKGKL